MPTYNSIPLDDQYSLRILDIGDVEALVRLSHAMHKESPYAHLALDEDFIRTMPMTFGLFHEGELVGFLSGMKTKHHLFKAQFATELAYYVLPQHRKKHSLELVRMYEAWAQDCDVLCLMNMNTPKLDKLYGKMGYTLLEKSYIKELR